MPKNIWRFKYVNAPLAFSEYLWRGSLMLMYCDLLGKNVIQLYDKGAFTYDVRCFLGIFDLPTYPNQILYYISLFSKIRCSSTYLPTQKSDVICECSPTRNYICNTLLLFKSFNYILNWQWNQLSSVFPYFYTRRNCIQ